MRMLHLPLSFPFHAFKPVAWRNLEVLLLAGCLKHVELARGCSPEFFCPSYPRDAARPLPLGLGFSLRSPAAHLCPLADCLRMTKQCGPQDKEIKGNRSPNRGLTA